MHYVIEHCAIIILAAGSSSRLGTPKQAIHFQGKTLLQHAIDEAMQISIQPIIVVVGAHDDAVAENLTQSNVHLIKNRNWQEGISSSIRCGLQAMQEINTFIDGVIVMVCDQPYVTHFLLESLLKKQQKSGQPIVASSYENILGTPVLFHKSFFSELMKLSGDSGARKLIRAHAPLTSSVSFPKGNIDIDTLEDYEKLIDLGEG